MCFIPPPRALSSEFEVHYCFLLLSQCSDNNVTSSIMQITNRTIRISGISFDRHFYLLRVLRANFEGGDYSAIN